MQMRIYLGGTDTDTKAVPPLPEVVKSVEEGETMKKTFNQYTGELLNLSCEELWVNIHNQNIAAINTSVEAHLNVMDLKGCKL